MRAPTSKRAVNLLREQFTLNGVVYCSGVHTDRGNLKLWGELVRVGYVVPMSKIWHPFAYELTERGRTFLKSPVCEGEVAA